MRGARLVGPATVGCAIALTLFCGMAGAEDSTGISGTVVDANGTAVGAAVVTLKNQRQQIVKEVVVPSSGEYEFTGVDPGTYSLLVMKDGFYPIVQEISLASDQVLHPDFQLSRYEFADEITVNFLAPRSTSGTKMDIPVRDIPVSVTSYTKGFMEAIKATRVSDVYDYMPGVSYQGLAQSFTIRGFETDGGAAGATTGIQVDGLPGLTTRRSSPSTINVERVEVVKGPASVLYGSLQPGGIVNLVTKKPQAEVAGTIEGLVGGFFGYGNSDQSYEGRADLTGPIDSERRFLYRLFASYEDAGSFRDFGWSKAEFYGGALTWNVSDSTVINFDGEYRYDSDQYDMGAVAPYNDVDLIPHVTTVYQEPGDFENDWGTAFALTLNKMFSNGLFWRVNTRAVSHKDHYAGYENRSLKDDQRTLVRQARDQLNRRKHNSVDTNFNWTMPGLGADHGLLGGVEVTYEVKDYDQLNITRTSLLDIDIYEPVYGTPLPPIKPSSHRVTNTYCYGAYLQDMITAGEHWKILAGVRYDRQDADYTVLATGDRITKSSSKALPMAGFVYQPNESWSLYGSRSESFSPARPDYLDRDGNPSFPPEEGRQNEIGAKFETAQGKADATLSLFDITRKNVAQRVETDVYQLIGEQQSRGAELEAHLRALDYRLQLIFGYSYIDSKVTEDVDENMVGSAMINSPKHSASVWTRYDFPESRIGAFSLGCGVIYKGERQGIQGEDVRGGILESRTQLILPGYVRVDASIHYAIKSLRFNLLAQNLFDELYVRYAENSNVRIFYGDPLQVRLTVGVAF